MKSDTSYPCGIDGILLGNLRDDPLFSRFGHGADMVENEDEKCKRRRIRTSIQKASQDELESQSRSKHVVIYSKPIANQNTTPYL